MYWHIAQYVIYYNHRNEIIIDERNISIAETLRRLTL